MAEFIIRWRDHWMDALTPQEIADRVAENPKFQAKYDRRLQKGDVLEIWPDGEGEWRVKGNPGFVVIKVPGLSVDPDYMAPLIENGIVLKRKKWSFPIIKIPPSILVELNRVHVITISLAQFTNLDILTRAQRSVEIFVPPTLEAKG